MLKNFRAKKNRVKWSSVPKFSYQNHIMCKLTLSSYQNIHVFIVVIIFNRRIHVLTNSCFNQTILPYLHQKAPTRSYGLPLSICCIQESNIQQPILGYKNLGSDMDPQQPSQVWPQVFFSAILNKVILFVISSIEISFLNKQSVNYIPENKIQIESNTSIFLNSIEKLTVKRPAIQASFQASWSPYPFSQ